MNSAFVGYEEIKQIWEGVMCLGLRLQWITPSLNCLILHILLSLIH